METAFYTHNSAYFSILAEQSSESFSIYTDVIRKYTPAQGSLLDVGCGAGNVVNQLAQEGYIATGIEIAEIFTQHIREKKGMFQLYDGKTIPFETNSFDTVGSYNVLEHVDDPELHIAEMHRVLKPGGHLIICTPNFLSATNSYHPHTKGFARKIQNLVEFLTKLCTPYRSFPRMQPIFTEPFLPDNDATNCTNPVDIQHVARKHKMKLKFYLGTSNPSRGIKRILSELPIIKYLMGSITMVYQKV